MFIFCTFNMKYMHTENERLHLYIYWKQKGKFFFKILIKIIGILLRIILGHQTHNAWYL